MATASDLQQLYIGYFGRAADQEGLNFWLDAINNGGLSLANVHASFVQSAEYNAQYEGMTVAQKVAAVYENVLGRVADEGGLEFWTNAITTGVITEDQLIEGLLSGLSANDAAIISNKIVVANYYTSAKGDAYVEASKAESAAILVNVDETVASVSTALTSVASVTGVSNAQLASALATLDAAQDAQQAYAEAYLGTSATGTSADVGSANTAITTALGAAAGALNTAIGNVGGTAVVPGVDSAANITTKIQSAVTLAANNVSAAQAAVSAVTGLTAKVNTFNTQLAAFENAVKVATAAEVEQAAELAKFNVVNGTTGPAALSVAGNGTVTGVITLDGSNLVIDTAYAAAATPVKLAAANELLADIKASLAAEKAQVDAATALNTTGAAIDALGADVYTPVSGDTAGSFATGPAAGLVDALTEQKALLDAIPKFSEAATTAAEFKALADAITAAGTAITGLGYTLEVVNAATEAGTVAPAKDVFLVGTVDSDVTITAGDVLFVGPGYKLGTDTDKTTALVEGGDPAVLEVFLTKAGAAGNVFVVVEQSAFGSNAASQEVTTIELIGVTDLNKVSFDGQTGLITIA